MTGGIPLLPYTPSWGKQGELYLELKWGGSGFRKAFTYPDENQHKTVDIKLCAE